MTPTNIATNVALKNKTTFQIGGPARYFATAADIAQLKTVQQWAQKHGVPYFILGGGSNLLVADRGYPGLVIALANSKLTISSNRVQAQAGVSLARLVEKTTQAGLSGLECCLGIPGTVGGAICGNAGAKDNWINQVIYQVKILTPGGEEKLLSQEECQFDYRRSRFSDNEEIVLSAQLELTPDSPAKIKARLTKYQTARQDQPRQPSAGSVFKNPPGESAGRLIDQAGLKGKQIGQARIAPQHANFIVNCGTAQAENVIQLMRVIQKEVVRQFDIKLKPEIKLIGFPDNPLLYD